MRAKQFTFENRTYKPIGNILGDFTTKTKFFSWEKTIEYSSHNNFYKVAKKNNASCDIFLCLEDNNYYIPLNNCLAIIDKKVFNTKHFKSIEEYEKWYH